jgi:uncharacterized protein YegL
MSTNASKFTEIAFILDRSGSMQSISETAVAGFNELLGQQQKEHAQTPVRMSLVLFNTDYEVPFASVPAPELPRLDMKTYAPDGGTALLDAIGRTIDETGARLAAMPEAERPGKVIIAILTDGEENSSREYSAAHIADLIEAKKERGWQFVFLAANQDAIATASALSIDAADALNFTCNEAGTADAFMEMSAKVSEKRRK